MMERVLDWFRQEGNRGYLYRVLAALGLLATGYGYLSGQEVALWLGLAAVVFNVTPAVNTRTGAQLRAGESDRAGHTYSSGGVIQPAPQPRRGKFPR